MQFEWDDKKAASNLAKHGLSFAEATTAFNDPLYLDFFDPDHSDIEKRYIRVGCTKQHRLVVVSYTERGDLIRLISARPATKTERQAYEEQ